MNPAEPSRREWRSVLSDIVGEPLAWMSSLAWHVMLLAVLALSTQLTPLDRAPVLFSPLPPEPLEPEVVALRVSDELMIDIGALADGGAGDAAATAPTEAITPQAVLDLPALVAQSETPTLEETTSLLAAPDPDNVALVRGVGAVGATGSSGAVDRLTREVLNSLEQRATLVVWLFDRSGSLKGQRDAVVERFDRVYEELGVAGYGETEPDSAADEDDPALLTDVAAFAADVEFVTRQPTADLESIKEAVRSIEPDDSGRENVFSAVFDTAQRHKLRRLRKPRRNVMIVVFTDEAGDDADRLDRAVEVCRSLQMRVYVVGSPAPFGRAESYVRYVDPDERFDQTPQWLPVRQGPESLRPERLRIGGFGRRGPREPTLDSGFGPYGLTRLTAETGGFYVAVHPFRVDSGRANRRRDAGLAAQVDYFFDERLMRRYRPDYVPVEEYNRRLAESPARRALVAASEAPWAAELAEARRDFPKIDDAQFADDLSRAQRAAARVEPQLRALVETLRRGEADRPSLRSPRWRAGYDLAMGRALAAKVRADEYNTALSLAKQGLEFSSLQKDTWVLQPSEQINGGTPSERDAEAAVAYLRRVVDEHPETPWAFLAQRELRRPLGWEWRDEFRDLVAARQRQANRPNRPNRPRPEPKPRRPPPLL